MQNIICLDVWKFSIFPFLSTKFILKKLSLISKEFNDICQNDIIWKNFVIRDFLNLDLYDFKTEITYKEMYKHLSREEKTITLYGRYEDNLEWYIFAYRLIKCKYHIDFRCDCIKQIKSAIKQNGWVLYYASGRLRDDREIVLIAVKQYGLVLKCASDRLKDDREIVLIAVKQDGKILKCASDRLKDDREIVLIVVKRNGYTFKYASERLKDDKEIVLTAVKQYGLALYYASDRLKNDPEVMMIAKKLLIK